MAFPFMAAAGFGGSLYGARKAAKAQAAYAEAMKYAGAKQAQALREIAAPYLEETKLTLPLLRQTIASQLVPRLSGSRYLKAAHEQNLTDIGREEERALASSRRAYSAGNLGRARGESLRIGRAGVEARGRENVSYGLTEQADRDTAAGRLINAYQGMVDIGGRGLQPAIGAAGVEANALAQSAGIGAAAKTDFWSDLGGLFGIPVGDYLSGRDTDRMKGLLSSFASPGAVNPSAREPQAAAGGDWQYDEFGRPYRRGRTKGLI